MQTNTHIRPHGKTSFWIVVSVAAWRFLMTNSSFAFPPNLVNPQSFIYYSLGNAGQVWGGPSDLTITSIDATGGSPTDGWGESIGVQAYRFRDIPDHQLRLTTGDFPVYPTNTREIPMMYHPVTMSLLAFDPNSVGLSPPFVRAANDFGLLLSQSTLVQTFDTSYESSPLSLEITDFIRSLPRHTDALGEYVDIGFATRILSSPFGVNHVVMSSLKLQFRDGSEETPILPAKVESGVNQFIFVPSGVMVDPPSTNGFRYQMTDGKLFTGAFGFPSRFSKPFVVSVNGERVGTFNAGESVDFSGFPGGGVANFDVTGISPVVDAGNPLVFPLGLNFNASHANFNMIPLPLGDANIDCSVGAADYAMWAAQFGNTGPTLSADFDGNGSVGTGDYTLWAANFGNSCPGGASVPEPTAGALFACGAAFLLATAVRRPS